MGTKAIDVSYCQTNVDYDRVKNSGIDVVIIRAGYGRESYQKDSEFETHYRNAKAAGLKVGAYWYSYADSVSDAVNEANACLACIKGKALTIRYIMIWKSRALQISVFLPALIWQERFVIK